MFTALRERKFKEDEITSRDSDDSQARASAKMRHKSVVIGSISPPIKMTEQTMFNLGKVHYQLAVSVMCDFLQTLRLTDRN